MNILRSIRGAVVVVTTIAILALAVTAPVLAKGGNSSSAKACQKGGWASIGRQDGTAFSSEQACVSYGAQGGTYGALAPRLAVDPSSWDAGDLFPFGSPQTQTQTFTVTNIGGAATGALTLNGLGFRFQVSNDGCSGTTLDPGESCTFDVTATSLNVNGLICFGGASSNTTAWITDPTHASFPGLVLVPMRLNCP